MLPKDTFPLKFQTQSQSMVVHTYNFNVWELRQENHKFEASLRSIARPCLKKKKNAVHGGTHL
jgi:hypothetical protein